MSRVIKNVKQQNLSTLCSEYDLSVLSDLEGEPDSDKTQIVYALGWQEELAAGIRGGTVTPYFDSLDELESYVSKNRVRIEREVGSE